MAKRKKTMKQLIKDNGHLPKFMRDFHDQKELFKIIHLEWLEKNPKSSASMVDLTSAHCYTIDCFLKSMAYFGYTLQPVDVLTKQSMEASSQALNIKLNEQLKSIMDKREATVTKL